MADYDWFDRSGEMERHFEVQKLRGLGFRPVWGKASSKSEPDHWECRRGCGTLVWNPEAHMANVCTTWDPMIG